MEDKPDFRIKRTEAHRASYEQLFADIEMSFWGPTGSAKDKGYVAQGTPGQRALFVLTLFARLVDNGRLVSFFECVPFYCPEVSEALVLLGLRDMHNVFTNAVAVVLNGKPAPDNDETAEEIFDALTEDQISKLDALSDQLYGESSVEERLFPYFKQYVDAHPDEFFKD